MQEGPAPQRLGQSGASPHLLGGSAVTSRGAITVWADTTSHLCTGTTESTA